MNATSPTSVNFAPKHLSGIDVIDDPWGGLYRGGSYLVYGRAASGRGLLTLMFARTGAAFSEPTLFVSPDRQKDLMIQAASIGFNLRQAHDTGIVRLMRVPPLMNLQNMGDDGVSKALWDLVTLIRRHRPTRLVMNDFMPFVAFRSFDRFRSEFIQFLEQIDSLDTTTMLVMPEPANPQSARVIEFMASQMTGSIHIELAEDAGNTTKRRISLIPHIGHIKRQVVDYWDLEDLVKPGVEMVPAASETPAVDEGPIFTASEPLPFAEAPASESEPVAVNPYQPSAHVESVFQPEKPAPTPPVQPLPPVHQVPPVPPVPQTPPAPHPSQFTEQASPVQPVMPPIVPVPTFNPERTRETPMPQAPSPVPPQLAASHSPQQEPSFGQMPPSTEVPGGSTAEVPPTPDFEPASRHQELDFTDRLAFRSRLQMQFSNRDVLHQPFLLLALRMDRSGQTESRPFDFDFLMDLVGEELRTQDDMLANTELERLVVYLDDSRPEEAQSFFTRLKDRLRRESPMQADHLLHSVSAIVVPDGRPFQSAGEFLNYALDEA